MAIDTVGVGDGKYGTAKEIKLAPVAAVRDRLSPQDIAFYESTGTEAWTTASSDELAQFQAAEAQKWGRVIKSAGIEPE